MPTTPAAASRAVDALADVLGADVTVPLLSGETVRFANLDYAATSPALRSVARRVAEIQPLTGSVHRGAGLPSQLASSLYEQARRQVASSVGARAGDHVVFTRNTTDAINLLAACVPSTAGDVVVLDVEHHANLLPWARAGRGRRVLPHATTVEETLSRLQGALRERRTALVAVTGASNVTGEILPLDRIVALAHHVGARTFVDGAQLIPHRRIDLAATGVDYVAFSGHKAYAPFGGGALAGRADWLEAAEPHLAGGGAVTEVTATSVRWAAGPRRHEAGTPNLPGAVSIAAALETLDDLTDADGRDLRVGHEGLLREQLLLGLGALPGVRTYRIWEDCDDAVGVVAFSVEGFAAGEVGAYLSAEHGIGVRDGRFCAHPLLERFGAPEGVVRASVGLGSRQEDVGRLLGAVERLVRGGPEHRYVRRADGWGPASETRDLERWSAGAFGPAC